MGLLSPAMRTGPGQTTAVLRPGTLRYAQLIARLPRRPGIKKAGARRATQERELIRPAQHIR